MIKDYQAPTKEYKVVFCKEPFGCELSFPCDEDGNVDLTKFKEHDVQSYKEAINHPEDYPCVWNEVMLTARNPATGICKCGKRIFLTDEYIGACECPDCHQWYNLFGQELNPPDQWGPLDYEY